MPEFIPPYIVNTTVHYHATAILYCCVRSVHDPIIQVSNTGTKYIGLQVYNGNKSDQ